jgi:hypothetical protein
MGPTIRGEASSILGGFWIKGATGLLVTGKQLTYGRINGYLTKTGSKCGVDLRIYINAAGLRIS